MLGLFLVTATLLSNVYFGIDVLRIEVSKDVLDQVGEVLACFLAIGAQGNSYVLNVTLSPAGLSMPGYGWLWFDVDDDSTGMHAWFSLVIISNVTEDGRFYVWSNGVLKEFTKDEADKLGDYVRSRLKDNSTRIHLRPNTTLNITLWDSVTIRVRTKTVVKPKAPVYVVVPPNTTITSEYFGSKSWALIYVQDGENVCAVLIPDDVWANSYIGRIVTTGELEDAPEWLKSANVSTIEGNASAGELIATIGANTSIEEVLSYARLNATGAEVYEVVELNETQMLMLSTCWQLMRAIPFEAPSKSEDPPWDFFEAVASFFCQVAEAVSNTFRAIVNAISDTLQHVMEAIEGALKVLKEAVQRLVEMIEAGVRLITAGLAAVANFLGKLFGDAVEFFRELGQKVWGALQQFVETIASVAKCVLYWMSWMWAHFVSLIMRGFSLMLECLESIVCQGYDIVQLDLPLHLTLSAESFVFELRGWCEERSIDFLGGEFWCVVFELSLSNGTHRFVHRCILFLGTCVSCEHSSSAVGSGCALRVCEVQKCGERPFVYRLSHQALMSAWRTIVTPGRIGSFIGLLALLACLAGLSVRVIERIYSAVGVLAAGLATLAIVAAIIGMIFTLLAFLDGVLASSLLYYCGEVSEASKILLDPLKMRSCALANEILSKRRAGALEGLMAGGAAMLLYTITCALTVVALLAPGVPIIVIAPAVALLLLNVVPSFELALFLANFVARGAPMLAGVVSRGVRRVLGPMSPEGVWLALAVLLLAAGAMLWVYLSENRPLLANVASKARDFTDLTPPEVSITSATYNETSRILVVSFTIDDREASGSRIMTEYTRVWLLRTPRSGERGSPYGVVSGVYDELTGEYYDVKVDWLTPINDYLKKNFGYTVSELVIVGTQEGEEITFTDVSGGEGKAYECMTSFDLSKVVIRKECRYFVVIFAIDELGNARWVVYDVTDLLRGETTSTHASSANISISTPNVEWDPRLVPRPELGWMQEYYVLHGRVRVPLVEAWYDHLEYHVLFELSIGCSGARVEIRELGFVLSGCVGGGLAIRNVERLWDLGRLTIVAGGEVVLSLDLPRWPAPLSLVCLLLYIFAADVAVYVVRRLRRRKSEPHASVTSRCSALV